VADPLDRAGVHAHAEGLLDRAGQLPGAQAGVGGQLFLGPGQDLAGELVAGARMQDGMSRHFPDKKA